MCTPDEKAVIPKGVQIVEEEFTSLKYKRCATNAQKRFNSETSARKDLLHQGAEIQMGTHFLKQVWSCADLATQAEDACADLIKAKYCSEIEVLYV